MVGPKRLGAVTLPRIASGIKRRAGAARRSAYLRNVGALLLSAAVAQVLPILLSPVLTRLYSPSDYGAFGLCVSVTALFSIVVTSQYTQAIILPRRTGDAVNLLALSAAASLAIGVVLATTLFFARDAVLERLHLGGGAAWLLAVPPLVTCNGWTAATTLWLIRKRDFGRISRVRIIQAVITAGLQLLAGVTIAGPLGLVGAYTVGTAVATTLLIGQLIAVDRRYVALLSWRRAKRQLREQANFLFYALPADLLNATTNQLPTLLLTKLVGMAGVGFYSLTRRVAGIPSGLIGNSVFEVFRQRAIAEYHERGDCRSAFVSTLGTLALIAIGPALLLFAFGPQLFSLVFGPRWAVAGDYARALSGLMFLRFVVSPLTYVYYIVGRQREDLVLHVLMIGSTVLSMWIGYRLFHTGLGVVTTFALSYSAMYVIYLVRSYQFALGRPGTDGARSRALEVGG